MDSVIPYPSVEKGPRIVFAMNVKDGDGQTGMNRGELHRTCDSHRSGNAVGCLGSDAVGHHGTVGMARHENPEAVDRVAVCQVIEEGQDKTDIVYVFVPGEPATSRPGARMPAGRTSPPRNR